MAGTTSEELVMIVFVSTCKECLLQGWLLRGEQGSVPPNA
jgi:hypothetical protein